MRIVTLILIPVLFSVASFVSGPETTPVSPLANYSAEWNNPIYLKCNTTKDANYMTGPEKDVTHILNLLRTNPALFAKTVVKQYPEKSGQGHLVNSWYYTSLLDTLKKIKPIVLLKPDINCFNSAKCHALYAGATGYVGHERNSPECQSKKYFNGECCDYGNKEPLDIVMSLLIDEGVPSLGHRDACLSTYKKIGVSIQAHQKYRYNAVLDFSY